MLTSSSQATAEQTIRKQLADLLRGGQAHATLADVVSEFPVKLRGTVPQGLPYSAWQLLEHIAIAQDDIVRFSTNYDGRYRSPRWPEGYWPKSPEPPTTHSWDEAVRQIERDRETMIQLIENPASDLTAPFPWGDGQNLLREILLIADHESHHLGELIVVRRILGIWPSK